MVVEKARKREREKGDLRNSLKLAKCRRSEFRGSLQLCSESDVALPWELTLAPPHFRRPQCTRLLPDN